MTGLPAPDDRQRADGQRELAAGNRDADPARAGYARSAGLWAMVLQRFRDYLHGGHDGAAGPGPQEEH